MNSAVPVITIDGPSGTGKGTLAQLLATRLDFHLLDSGALYRAVAVGAEAAGVALDDEAGLCTFATTMCLRFSARFPGSIELEGKEISELVRLEDSGTKASLVATLPALRAVLLSRQRAFRQPPGLVADGRDMGTVVFPDALLKLFLTASAEVRAERRYKQLINKGVGVSLRTLLHDIRERDERDSTRSVAPLLAAADAIVIDTSLLGIDDVFSQVMEIVASRLPVPPPAT